jgi:hypothetical protein
MRWSGRLTLAVLALAADRAAAQEAILDTARPFVAGAREEEQFLRGPIGWPTYQAGTANGLFYRFDPDGYARFGSTERLDEGFWDVSCTPRPIDCIARRGSVAVGVDAARRPTLALDNFAPEARFRLGEEEGPGRTLAELSAPAGISQLLETSELVPAEGGETVPLDGLATVVAYMQWVEAGQPDDLRLDANPRHPIGAPPADVQQEPVPPPDPVATGPEALAPSEQQPAEAMTPVEPLPPPVPEAAEQPASENQAGGSSTATPPGPAPARAEPQAAPGLPAMTSGADAKATRMATIPAAKAAQLTGPATLLQSSQAASPASATATCIPGTLPPAQLLKPADSLRSLPGIQLITDFITEPDALKGKLRPAVRKLAEERLKLAGIRLLSPQEVEQVPGRPRLELYLTKGDPARGCPFRVWMSVRQEVALARDSSIRLITGTWGDGGASRAAFAKDAEVETFAYYIDRFIKDWQAAKTSRPEVAAAPAPTTVVAAPPASSAPVAAATASTGGDEPDAVLGIQMALRDAGYDVGATDGRLGQRTRAAIRAFERDHGLPVTGVASQQVLDRLLTRRAQLPP